MSIAEWMESTWVATLVRDTLWGFPIVVAIHILGLTLSVGMVLWFDLRLLGITLRNWPVSTVYRRIIPWAGTGFALMFASGGMLLTAYATAAFGNVYFRLKAATLLAAAANALIYHLFTERRIAVWDTAGTPPRAARIAGLTSIALWATVIIAGRMMSYTMF